MNRLKELLNEGQSIWLDYIRRDLIRSGELKRMIEEDGIRGITSNPTIFEKAMAGSTDYDDQFRQLIAADNDDVGKLYERMAIVDIQEAADLLRPTYDETGGADGFVSLEVSPHLAHDTSATIAEAKRLKAAVNRPNLMIKVPATQEGLPAIQELIAGGVNVNITLMFSMRHYEAVARAYLNGLERCADPASVASVASFFVSRVDTAVDKALENVGTEEALAVRGKIAIANSKVVYRRFLEIFHGEGFAALRQRGARVQRPLWASTGTKNPQYSDVLYVEELVGRETVNTLPLETIKAFNDHGSVRGATVREGLQEAEAALQKLTPLGIDLEKVTQKLQDDGVAAFATSFDQLMASLGKKRRAIAGFELVRQELHLGKYERRVNRRLIDWQEAGFSERLWKKDTTLWSAAAEPELGDRLGWLDLPEAMKNRAEELQAFAAQVKNDGIRHVVLLGMGGSSLAPEVFQRTFGNEPGYPSLRVLDSTHPAAVKSVLSDIELARSVFIVSSKSGTTTETNSFFYYFWDKLKEIEPQPGSHFIAITDPGTVLERLAAERKFRAVFTAPSDVGGRYSALTVFGLVPAALIGVDVADILARARRMSEACGPGSSAAANPGLVLGAALGELTLAKRDKVTFLCSPSLAAFPAWVEQLIAESTGKSRKGIVPVANVSPASPEKYAEDRLFVYVRLSADENHMLDRQVAALEANGHPIVRMELNEVGDLGQEFFRWEVAVAAAGAALRIHPFNQPDVQLAKDLAKKAMAKDSRRSGARKDEVLAADSERLEQALSSWLATKKPRDYISIQAYLDPTEQHTAALEELAAVLRDRLGLAVTVGYGPRFLHSTGQLHKGGPNSIMALQIVDEPVENLAVPETEYTFDALVQAQAWGDFTALKQRRRRVLRVNAGTDPAGGIAQLTRLAERAGQAS